MVEREDDVVRERGPERLARGRRVVGRRIAAIRRDGEVEQREKRVGQRRVELGRGGIGQERWKTADVVRIWQLIDGESAIWKKKLDNSGKACNSPRTK